MPTLHIDTKAQLQIPSEGIVGISAAILGVSGSGKSNTAAVIIEELLANGFPMTIVDIEGEYWGLKERFEILVAGQSERCDVQVNRQHAEALAELSVTKRVPVVLDMSEFPEEEMLEFLLLYFTKLWEVTKAVRQPYHVVLEEAHEFVPQGSGSPLKHILTRIALRGRKRGLATLLISQRSPKVEKDLLTQAQLLFLHKVVHPIDVRVYQDIVPLPAKQVEEMVGKLEVGEAIVLYKNNAMVAHIRRRDTFHVGATPTLNEVQLPELRKIDLSILKELQSATTAPQTNTSTSASQSQARVKELEHIIDQQKAEIEGLRTQINARNIAAQSSSVSTSDQSFEVRDQQKLFEDLLTCIRKLPRAYHKAVLKFLIEREGKLFSAKDVSRILDLRPSTIQNASSGLLQLGLIKRVGAGPQARYISVTSELCKQEFPSLNLEQLRASLLEKLG